MKKGKITTIESACIKGMVANNIDTADIATQLNRGLATVEKEIERIKAEAVKEQLYIKETASGNKGVSIMTEAASVKGDVAKDTNTASNSNILNTRSPWIHTINKSNG